MTSYSTGEVGGCRGGQRGCMGVVKGWAGALPVYCGGSCSATAGQW